MTPYVRKSSIVLVGIFVILSVVLFALRDTVFKAHINETIYYFSSDGPVYFKWYDTVYAGSNVLENWKVFLRASPLLFMILTDGNLLLIQACNLALMLISLKVAMGCLSTLRGRLLFLACALTFPYFGFGFLSLNKEVYAMCSTIFYASYMMRGYRAHLLIAFLLALCARYYMVASLLMLLTTLPRDARPRKGFIIAILLTISVIGPFTKQSIPEYSHENLLEGSGTISKLFAMVIDNFGYALVYPIKYLLLLPTRAYGYMLGGSHDMSGAIVSILSILMIAVAVWLWLSRQLIYPMARRLIIAGFVAPIPIMWSEIMHWRYYSFVYFFFLFAVLLNMEKRQSERLERRIMGKSGTSRDGPARISMSTVR